MVKYRYLFKFNQGCYQGYEAWVPEYAASLQRGLFLIPLYDNLFHFDFFEVQKIQQTEYKPYTIDDKRTQRTELLNFSLNVTETRILDTFPRSF